MKRLKPPNEILTISSYPPRACGIATYSQDLIKALRDRYGQHSHFPVCALEDGTMNLHYGGHEVEYILDTSKYESYQQLAIKVNARKNIKAVLLQHEFGLFGGTYGIYLMDLLAELEKPIISTFHSVLPQPDAERKRIVQEICDRSQSLIVMTNQSAKILRADYAVSPKKISVIPHGTHVPPFNNRNRIRREYDLEGRFTLSTFGLLGPNKSIETALDALPSIKESFPNVLYLVLGKTHPGIVKHDGEGYREFLEAKVKALGLVQNVRFVNKYLTLDELLHYLVATDLYLFTSKDRNQAVSGTFAYAMSAGCPIISTAIPHAREWIDDNTGILVDFERSDQLAEAAIRLLADGNMRQSMANEALNRIRPTHWNNVAVQTGKLFEKHLKLRQHISPDYPKISLDHIHRMTTETGIIQFSKLGIPDPASGYTLDDNARALIVTLRHFEIFRSKEDVPYLEIYLDFINRCQREDGSFLNYFDQEGAIHIKNQYVNLEDSNGRAIWALGQLMASRALLPPKIYPRADRIIQTFLPHVPKVGSPRAMAFLIKGLYHYNLEQKSIAVANLIDQLAEKLVQQYHEISNDNWQWFEKYLTYGNSTMPEAMLYAYLATEKPAYKIIAKTTFDFLLRQIFKKGRIRVISNNGWFHYNKIPQIFGEQPIDVAYTIEALDVFYHVFKEAAYRKKMDIAFSWFLGNNHLEQYIYNAATGGCYDGLEEHHINLNQGAESSICYLMARLTMEKYLRRESHPSASGKRKKPSPARRRGTRSAPVSHRHNLLPVVIHDWNYPVRTLITNKNI